MQLYIFLFFERKIAESQRPSYTRITKYTCVEIYLYTLYYVLYKISFIFALHEHKVLVFFFLKREILEVKFSLLSLWHLFGSAEYLVFLDENLFTCQEFYRFLYGPKFYITRRRSWKREKAQKIMNFL